MHDRIISRRFDVLHQCFLVLCIMQYIKSLSVDGDGPDQTARTRRVISAFTVNICPHLPLIDALLTISSAEKLL